MQSTYQRSNESEVVGLQPSGDAQHFVCFHGQGLPLYLKARVVKQLSTEILRWSRMHRLQAAAASASPSCSSSEHEPSSGGLRVLVGVFIVAELPYRILREH